jgi:hypothetical protein
MCSTAIFDGAPRDYSLNILSMQSCLKLLATLAKIEGPGVMLREDGSVEAELALSASLGW